MSCKNIHRYRLLLRSIALLSLIFTSSCRVVTTPSNVVMALGGSMSLSLDLPAALNATTSPGFDWVAVTTNLDLRGIPYHFEYAIGTSLVTPEECDVDIFARTNNGVATAVPPIGGLTLVPLTTYYLCTYLVETGSGDTLAMDVDTFVVDNTPPVFAAPPANSADAIIDGTADSILFSWSAPTETQSGIDRYEYCITQTFYEHDATFDACTAYGVSGGWVDNGTLTTVNITDADLTTPGILYMNVRAVDNVNNVSAIIFTRPFLYLQATDELELCDIGNYATTCTINTAKNLNTFISSPNATGIRLNNLIITGAGSLTYANSYRPIYIDANTVDIQGGAVVSSSYTYINSFSNVTVDGTISAEGFGYLGGLRGTHGGLDNEHDFDRAGPGAGQTDHIASGGGHGGDGGLRRAGGLLVLQASEPGYAYGDINYPVLMGSGGGGSLGTAGNNTFIYGDPGGGVVRINSQGDVDIDGTLNVNGRSNGAPFSWNETTDGRSGAGAGGSLFVEAVNFTGSGTMTANGGNFNMGGCGFCNMPGGSGGGGRIAIILTGANTSTIIPTVNAGLEMGANPETIRAQNGTVVSVP